MKKYFALMLVMVFSLSMVSASRAEGNGERSVRGFFQRVFNWGPKTIKNTGEMTANTLNNTGDKVLSQTGENIAKGDLGGVIAQPVKGTLETTGQTAAETVQAPIKAAEEEKTS